MTDGTVKTDERMIIDVPAMGYKKTDVKIKLKTLNDKTKVIVVDVQKSSADNQFGVYKDLPAFRKEYPVNDEVYDLTKVDADVNDGIIRISVPKKDDYKTKTLVDFASSNTPQE